MHANWKIYERALTPALPRYVNIDQKARIKKPVWWIEEPPHRVGKETREGKK
jgi:hypothetical protein